jgi:hypothetical protein
LVDEKGVFVDYFLPITQPDSKRITSKLKWYNIFEIFYCVKNNVSLYML